MSRSPRSTRVRTEKEKSLDHSLDIQEQIHAAHAARKDYILVKFLEEEDNNTLILNMSTPSCKGDWRVIEDCYYSGFLEPGDLISVRASKKMDAKRRFYEAEVMEIKTTCADSDGQEHPTPLRKKPTQRKPVSPSKREDDLEFINDLSVPEPAGKVQWLFDPYTGLRLDVSKASPDEQYSMPQSKARTGKSTTDVKKRQTTAKTDIVMLEYSDDDSDAEGNAADDERSFSRTPHKRGGKQNAGHPRKRQYLSESDDEQQAGFSRTKKATVRRVAVTGLEKEVATPSLSPRYNAEQSVVKQGKPGNARISGHTKAKRAEGRSDEQVQLLNEVKASLQSRGQDKCELFPGSHRYISKSRLNNLKVHWHLKHPMYDAVSLASMVFGSSNNILTLFTGAHFGLKAALGEDVVRDLLAFINSAHPGITANREQPITADALYKAFSRRVWYLRGSETKSQGAAKEGSPEV